MMITAEEQILKGATSTLLQMHVSEIAEECENIVIYCRKLRQRNLTDDERYTYEGKLYAALTHLQNHVRPATEEWDRWIDSLPDDEDDEDE
jgi:hypothetical protein